MKISVDLSGIKDLLKKYRNGLVEGVKESMLVAEKWSKQSFGKPGHLKSRTGNLRRSINVKVEDKGKSVLGIIGTAVKYGPIHELGGTIPPHFIRPDKKKALRFFVGGEAVFSKGHMLPAIKIPARPYLAPAITENANVIRNIIMRRVSEESNK